MNEPDPAARGYSGVAQAFAAQLDPGDEPSVDALAIYQQAQVVEPWPDGDYPGTPLRDLDDPEA